VAFSPLAGPARDPRRRARAHGARGRRADGRAQAMRRATRLAVLLLAGCGGSKSPPLVGVALDPPVHAPNFSLEDQSGGRVSVAGQRGPGIVVAFLSGARHGGRRLIATATDVVRGTH